MWNYILSWFGLRTRGTATFRCGECEYEHVVDVWCRPDESVMDAIQREVQAEFEKQNGTKL